jgi:hypothetical protein
MTKIQALEKKVSELSHDELAEFRQWFDSYNSNQWDSRIEADANAGKLDQLAARALEAHRSGESREI